MEKNIIYKIIHGSRLYGTYTPYSDLDITGVYAPFSYDVLSGKEKVSDVKYSANKKHNEKSNKDTIEHKYYSLVKFFQLLAKGDIACTEMLFANKESTMVCSEFFKEYILKNRNEFISKKVLSFVSCAKSNYYEAIKEMHYTFYHEFRIYDYIYNALRLNYEVYDLVTTGNIEFPLVKADFLYDIRSEKISYENVIPLVEQLIEKNESLIVENTELPDEINFKLVDDIIKHYYEHVEER